LLGGQLPTPRGGVLGGGLVMENHVHFLKPGTEVLAKPFHLKKKNNTRDLPPTLTIAYNIGSGATIFDRATSTATIFYLAFNYMFYFCILFRLFFELGFFLLGSIKGNHFS